MSDRTAQAEQLKARLKHDFELVGQPFAVAILCVIILGIQEYVWDDAYVLLLIPLLWAIPWIVSWGIPRTIGAILRIPVNAVRLLLLIRKTHRPTNRRTDGPAARGEGSGPT